MANPPEVDADIVVLTALGFEYDAVRRHLGDVRPHVDRYGSRYLIGGLDGGPDRVALTLVGAGNLAAAVLAGRAIEEFGPGMLMMVGVAGGLADDVDLGDVVVGTRILAYHGGRDDSSGFRPRPKGWPLPHALEQAARHVAGEDRWRELLPGDLAGSSPTVHFKPIVSGEVVLDSRRSPLAALIADHYGDAIAIDMESAGVAEAAHRKDFHRAVTIRGISDFADGAKRHTDEQGWQPKAAAAAAAFAMALVKQVSGRPMEPDRAGPASSCPYRGLAAFGEQDAELFFGRAEQAGELAELASRTRFTAVVGRSACGKSSLVNAGLVPRMRERGWAIAAFRPMPGVPAATALAGGLLPLLRPGLSRVEAIPERATLAEAIAGGRLLELVGEVLAETGTTRLLVSVDQFEEFLTQSEAAARELCGLLVQLSRGAAPAHVVLTLRTESLDIAVSRLGLGEVTRNSVLLVTPMRPEQLREAVEAPLESTGLSFEPGLVERILDAAADAPAALSLMQFALTRLWEQQDSGLLTHSAYAGFGGVEGAVADYAEEVWTGDLDDAERGQARRLLVQLVRPSSAGDVIRRTARDSELKPDLVRTARRLATTRLVVTGADDAETTYDLAHAALARHWQRLGDWLNEEREFRAWQEDLREGMRRDEPLRGPRLAQALRWKAEHPDDISPPERDFINTSRQGHRRRTAMWRSGLAVIVILLILVSTFAVFLRQQSGETERQLRRNAAQLLSVQAGGRFSGEPDTAVLMAVAAYETSPDPGVQAYLAGEYLRFRSTTRLLSPGIGPIRQVEMSADGQVIAALGDGVAHWRPGQTGPQRYGNDLRRIALSADGNLLAGAAADGRIEVRKADGTVTVLHRGGLGGGVARRLRFDPEGRRLLAFLPGQGLRIWDLQRQVPVPIPATVIRQTMAYESTISFGPDADHIVVFIGKELVLWRLSSGKVFRIPTGRAEPTIAGNGRTAIACTGGTYAIWDLTSRKVRRQLRPASEVCPHLIGEDKAGHTGSLMLTSMLPEGDNDHPRRRATLLNMETGLTAHPVVPDIRSAEVFAKIATTTEASRLISPLGSSIAVIDVSPDDFKPISALSDNHVRSPRFSEDQRLAITAAATNPRPQVQVWDTTTGRELGRAPNPAGDAPVGFSADGRTLLMRDRSFQYLEILDVPSLHATARVPLPAAPGVRPTAEVFLGPFNGLCAEPTAGGTFAVVFGGLISRFDPRTGALADRSVQLWRDKQDLDRLAVTTACSIRPGRDEIAFDARRSIELWDLNQGRQLITLPIASTDRVADIRFSPDGRLLASLSQDGMLEVWDLDEHKPRITRHRVLPAGLFNEITGFPAGNRVVVRNTDQVRIWDLEHLATIADIDIPGVSHAASSHRASLLLWSRAGLVHLPLTPRRWTTHLCQIVGRDFTKAERKSLPPGIPTAKTCPPS